MNMKTVRTSTVFSCSPSSFQSVGNQVSPHAHFFFSKIDFCLVYSVESLLLFFHQSCFPYGSPILLAQQVYCHTGCISDYSCISLTVREGLKGYIKTVLQDKQDDYSIFPHLCTLRHCSQLYIYTIHSWLGCSVKARYFKIKL